MERSLEVLKPFGRFLELGKRDLYLNRRIHLRPLRQNISYFAIDIDQLPIRRPDLARLPFVRSPRGAASRHDPAARAPHLSFAELDDAPSGSCSRRATSVRLSSYRVPMTACGYASRRRSHCAATEPTWSPVASMGSAMNARAGWRAHGAGSIALSQPPRAGAPSRWCEDQGTRRGRRTRCAFIRAMSPIVLRWRRSSRRSEQANRPFAASCMPPRRSMTASPPTSTSRTFIGFCAPSSVGLQPSTR